MAGNTAASRVLAKAFKLGFDSILKATSFRFGENLQRQLEESTARALRSEPAPPESVKVKRLSEFDLTDGERYQLHRPDIYKTFKASEEGPELDEFVRKGRWTSRGVLI